jgi:hypothetical protein
MKTISRVITITLNTGIFVAMGAFNAFAGCGEIPKAPFEFPEAASESRVVSASAHAETALQRGSSDVPIAGMWKFQFISKGNTSHNPSIPDGALIDYGFLQWHTDGTEIQNSAGVPGGGFCLGVWGQTGYLTFERNHFPIAFNPTTGKLANYINIHEQDTLSPSGDSYTGTFTEDIYDPTGKQVDQVVGTVSAERVTVDSVFPGIIPTSSTN